MKVNIPSDSELADLIEHRDPASVTVYLPSSPVPAERERLQLALRQHAKTAEDALEAAGIDGHNRRAIADSFDRLQTDREFWDSQARSLALFLSPSGTHAFHVANDLPEHLSVGDRFDVGPLLRSVSFTNEGFVLTITQSSAHLYELRADRGATEVPLADLPEDASEVLRQEPHGGQADRVSDTGALGPKIQQRKYCSVIQDAVLPHLGDDHIPLILCATDDLEPAYREVNTYRHLAQAGIPQHPDSLTPKELDQEARAILDALYAEQLAGWKERFENLRGEGTAVSQLTEVARAATAGAVSELCFDLESTALEGTIDDAGAIHPATDATHTTYGLIDELAVRVLRTGGTVRAVRKGDLPDDSPVAAILRYPPVL